MEREVEKQKREKEKKEAQNKNEGENGTIVIETSAQEDEGIEWEDEEEARVELALVGKIWTKRKVKTNAFMTTIKNFYHWKDKSRVMEGQPWHFDNHAILLANMDNNTKPSDTQLFMLPMWVRVYNFPFKGRFNENNGLINQFG
ncbi:Peripheral-type benzodiazepine receptor-associated protein 1 [Bienertia sinuspersici]